MATSDPFIAALTRAAAFLHPVERVRVVETHISWILLTGEFAYKVKKPVDLGFLDFSTLEARHHACQEELRLNRRLAPELYLGVVPITGNPSQPAVEGSGPPFEYAVKMRQFPDDAVLDAQLESGHLDSTDIDAIAELVANFHRNLEPADPTTPWGNPEGVWRLIQESLDLVAAAAPHDETRLWLDRIAERCRTRFERARDRLIERKCEGKLRECHGDLHLANLVRLNSEITAFDALEFDPQLRWVDVINEAGFLVMDLAVRGREDLAYEFLNRYLVLTGDYDGLAVLPLFLSDHALVRAKVTALSPAGDAHTRSQRIDALLRYAENPVTTAPFLIVTCGLAGSGKTYLSRRLATLLPAVHLRSDVERKRMFGLAETARTGAEPGGGIYTASATAATYMRLGELAKAVLDAGFTAIVDATCQRAEHRLALIDVARRRQLPVVVLYCRAERDILSRRVQYRLGDQTEASEANRDVLALQIEKFQTPDEGEADALVTVDTGRPESVHAIAARLTAAIRR